MDETTAALQDLLDFFETAAVQAARDADGAAYDAQKDRLLGKAEAHHLAAHRVRSALRGRIGA